MKLSDEEFDAFSYEMEHPSKPTQALRALFSDSTFVGTAIPPRSPQRSTRSVMIRAMLEYGPFLAAFDARMCEE